MRQTVRPYFLDEAVNLILNGVNEQVRQNLAGDSGAPVFLGVSGIDCSGKTTLAKALLARATAEGLNSRLLMADDFFIPEADRQSAPEPHIEWFENTFDHTAFVGSIRSLKQNDDAQLVIGEGVFLFRQELVSLWDLKVWMEMSAERSIRCGMDRDAEFFGSPENARAEYLKRFIPAHEHHLKRDNPVEQAHFVFEVE